MKKFITITLRVFTILLLVGLIITFTVYYSKYAPGTKGHPIKSSAFFLNHLNKGYTITEMVDTTMVCVVPFDAKWYYPFPSTWITIPKKQKVRPSMIRTGWSFFIEKNDAGINMIPL